MRTRLSALALLILTIVPGGASAQEEDIPNVVGHFGFGYFTTTAPLGLRYWLSESSGIDAGVGLTISKAASPEGGPGSETQVGFGFEVGYLWSFSRTKNLNLFLRPGLGFRFQETGASDYDVSLNGSLGAEMFLAGLGLPFVSLTAALGLNIAIDAPENNDVGFGFALFNTGASIVQSSALIGIHFYL